MSLGIVVMVYFAKKIRKLHTYTALKIWIISKFMNSSRCTFSCMLTQVTSLLILMKLYLWSINGLLNSVKIELIYELFWGWVWLFSHCFVCAFFGGVTHYCCSVAFQPACLMPRLLSSQWERCVWISCVFLFSAANGGGFAEGWWCISQQYEQEIDVSTKDEITSPTECHWQDVVSVRGDLFYAKIVYPKNYVIYTYLVLGIEVKWSMYRNPMRNWR